MLNAQDALTKVLSLPFDSVLDIGSGEGLHSRIFKEHGKDVTCLTYEDGDYMCKLYDKQFDCIWASHVLEHMPNPNKFLNKCAADLKDGGILAITVPPLKHDIVGGHVSLWNAGLLLYHLILAGFDCSQAMIKEYGYNISVIVKKKIITLPKLKMDSGDIIKLSEFFPFEVKEPFDGRIKELNW